MLSLSQTAGYGILALGCLDTEHWALAQQISERTGVPKPYLSKLLHALARAQLILAKRGYRGGFRLARPAPQISLMDIVEAVDGRAWIGRCLLGLETCSDERACPTHAFWKEERARIHDCLVRISLSDVAQFEQRRKLGLSSPTTLGGRLGERSRGSSSNVGSGDDRAGGGADPGT